MDSPVKDSPLECARWNCQFRTLDLDKFIAHVAEHDAEFAKKISIRTPKSDTSVL